MIRFNETCTDSADWVESITGYRPANNVITIEELEEISQDENRNGGENGIPSHWDYPLNEIPDIMNDEIHDGTVFGLVRFDAGSDGYEYRVCEFN